MIKIAPGARQIASQSVLNKCEPAFTFVHMRSFKLPSKEVDTLAEYTKNREINYEMKYLRKVMGQVDQRIRVPESVSADSLRHLLNSVEAPSVREAVSRRPFKLSLQSGIAYAAAFALIVALFYATRLYRPDIISGGMDISTTAQQPADTLQFAETPNPQAPEDETQTPFIAADAAAAPIAAPASLDAADTADTGGGAEDIQPRVSAFGIGGSGKANLILEQDEYAFYWRENDLSDPDRTSPISFEVVDTVTQEAVTHTDVPLLAVFNSFGFDGNIVLVGTDLGGEAAICSYDIPAAGGTFEPDIFAQDGFLIDANVNNNIIRIVSLSVDGESGQDAELLPNSVSGEICLITIFDPKTQAIATKQFIGANGTVQLNDQNAYIQYTGQDENGEDKEYVAQILFDGMDITLAE